MNGLRASAAGLAAAGLVWVVAALPEGPRFEAWPLVGRVFVVDPGHGGIDGGCQWGGLMEKDVVLPVALELTRRLREAGARVGLTRNQDMELGHMTPRGGSRYHRDLRTRVAVARRLGPDLFISLHANASRRPEMNGAVVFYYPGRAHARRAAERILEELAQVVPGNQNAALPADLFVLRENPYPAVLVELGFLTHPKDRAILTDPDGQRALAAALFRALVRLHAQEPAFPQPPPDSSMGPSPAPSETAARRVDRELCPSHLEP